MFLLLRMRQHFTRCEFVFLVIFICCLMVGLKAEEGGGKKLNDRKTKKEVINKVKI